MNLSHGAMEVARHAGLFAAAPPDVIDLVLPYPPSVNTYWRSFVPKGWRRATVHVSDEGKAYQYAVRKIIQSLHVDQLICHLVMDATLFPPDKRRRDLDNPMKALLDAMKHAGAYADDSQIQEMHIRFGAHVKGGRAVVKLSTMGL